MRKESVMTNKIQYCQLTTKRLLNYAVIGLLCVGAQIAAAQVATQPVSDFAGETLEGWEEKEFSGQTQYKFERIDGEVALSAFAQASASGLFKTVVVDLQQYPWLNWRWRVDKPLSPTDETTKQGDDYAARIYVVFDGGWRLWRSRAISYVWSSSASIAQVWPNAFTGDKAMVVAVANNDSGLGVWRQEKVNVLADMRKYFGD